MTIERRLLGFVAACLVAGGCVRDDGEGDAVPPTGDGTSPLTIAAPVDVMSEASGPLTVVTLGEASASGGDGARTIFNDAPAAGFSVGAHSVTWTATDNAGASASDTQQIQILDTTAPIVTAPADISVDALGATTPVVIGMGTAVDIVDGPVAVTHDAPLDGFVVGTTRVSWTATDAAGNSGLAMQDITVIAAGNVIGDPAAGSTRYAQQCMGCHGADPTLNIANILNGDTPANVVTALETVAAMAPIATLASDVQAVADLAAFIAEQKAMTPITGNIDAGRIAYQQNCSGCHGDNLAENRSNILNGDNVPAIQNALMTVPSMATLSALLAEPQTLADLAAFIADEKANVNPGSGTVGLIPEAADCTDTPILPIDTIVRRLTRFEYRNTVFDVLGIDIDDQMDLLPIETRPAGFSNDALSLVVTLEHIEGFNQLAAIVAERIGNPAALLASHATCTDATSACYDAFIESLGERIYRSPVDGDEVTHLRDLFAAAAAEDQGFADGALLVVRAMLQSPRFLYRTELRNVAGAGSRQLNSYEIAARLSYLIWASAPDEALLASARNNELVTTPQIVAAADRLLADARARRVTEQLVREWFDLDLVASLDRNSTEHPNFTPQIAADMQREAMNLFEQIIWEQGAPMIDAYNSTTTFASQQLADYYGLGPASGSLGGGTNIYNLDADSERAGLLTQGAVVAVSGGRDASLVHRGLFVLNRVMCSSVQQPPAGLDTTPPEVLPGASARVHSEARVANPVCGGCHYQVDPLGYAFERFDAAGAVRDTDSQGNALSGAGTYEESGIGAIGFANAREFADAVVASPTARDCIVVRPTQFAFGTAIDPSDTAQGCFLSDIRGRADGATASYQDIIRSIVSSSAFRTVAEQ